MLLFMIAMLVVSIPLCAVSGQVYADTNVKGQSQAPELSQTVDFTDTLTVKEFTEMVLKAIGREATMEYAISKEFVRPSANYPSYDKPILRREAALTVARIMDDITGMTALFTSGKNDYFFTGYTLNHRLQGQQIDKLINDIGLKNGTYDKYFTLIYWQDYVGNIKDIRMIAKEYLKEMATTYYAGLMDADENGRLRPYDFLTKEEAEELAERLKRYDLKDSQKAIEQLAKYVRDLDEKPMENFLKSIDMRITYKRILDGTPPEPEIEAPSNKELWASICPYVNKRLYEYPVETSGLTSNKQLEIDRRENPLDIFNNAFAHLNDYERYVENARNYMNTRYNVDYRYLDEKVPYYGSLVVNQDMKKETGDYRTRVLFYYNPEDILNGIEDENCNERPEGQWIMPDNMIDAEIEKIKKHKIVSQAEFMTDNSLMYYKLGSGHIRGTLRIIFYPPTDPEYLKSKGLEVGKWYEKDVELLFSNRGFMKGDREKYRDRWAYTLLFYENIIDLDSMSYLNLNDILDFKNFRPLEVLQCKGSE